MSKHRQVAALVGFASLLRQKSALAQAKAFLHWKTGQKIRKLMSYCADAVRAEIEDVENEARGRVRHRAMYFALAAAYRTSRARRLSRAWRRWGRSGPPAWSPRPPAVDPRRNLRIRAEALLAKREYEAASSAPGRAERPCTVAEATARVKALGPKIQRLFKAYAPSGLLTAGAAARLLNDVDVVPGLAPRAAAVATLGADEVGVGYDAFCAGLARIGLKYGAGAAPGEPDALRSMLFVVSASEGFYHV
eukprot:CAMPEP_0119266172 /NCGR_PEP_ID=MMETSP1329-20130426/4752_1 /TAXON_ID=114041 /ORGANISM="Genus nov. species nov., Strain RCC1024" /LENGTH=248 /DNA_ID=CAMNT_0007266039 /DNA_START=4 /DNA_END=746 /DNA_ORIENTATION=+